MSEQATDTSGHDRVGVTVERGEMFAGFNASMAMNATTFADFRTGAISAVQNDEKMEQIRELLFGEYQRQSEARLALIEARVRELELAIHHRLDAMQGRIEQLAGQTTADQRAAFDELAHGIAELGERVRRLR